MVTKHCGKHFAIHLYQIIMLYTLNLFNDICNYISIKLEEKTELVKDIWYYKQALK